MAMSPSVASAVIVGRPPLNVPKFDSMPQTPAMMRAGTRRAFGNAGAIAQVSPEAIVRADPDVLLFAGAERDLKELVARPGFGEMRAVRTGRTHIVSRAQFLIPGPRTFDGIESLARVLHPVAS